MRKVINGYGQDVTTTVAAYLRTTNLFQLANLYLIGDPDDPRAYWLTDWSSPLWWPVWGNVAWTPTTITRGSVASVIGLDSPNLDITWTPTNLTYSASVDDANIWQLAQQGYYDNWPVRVWSAYILPGGDLMTYGCSELFGGVVGKTTTGRKNVTFNIDSFLYPNGLNVPTNTIELLNTLAAYKGASPPAGFTTIPFFNVVTGDSSTVVEGDGTTGGGGTSYIYGDNVFRHGYMVFNAGAGATLAGVWAAIQQNKRINIGGTDYNQFILYQPLPWPPTPGVDTFFVSATAPINQDEGEYFGFPYVPIPESAI